MNYLLLKYVHIGLAGLSVSGFVLRWALMSGGSRAGFHRIVRVTPHVLDTVFLASGITLAVMSGFQPWNSNWLAAKIVGLVVYIALGMVAMKSKPGAVRNLAFLSALLVFAWVVSVALLKSPPGFLNLAR